MKKIMIAALLLISFKAFSQPIYRAEKVYTKQLYIKDVRVDSVTNDTTLSNESAFNLATVPAIKKYVNRAIANNTVSTIAWANITGKPTANGTTTGLLSSSDWLGFDGKQAALNGSGLVFMNGTTVSYKSTLDSTIVSLLHSENYYNAKYLKTSTTLSFFGGIDSIRQPADVLYANATFSKSGTTGISNASLNTQSSWKVFGTSSSSAAPAFVSVDSSHFNNLFSAEVNAAAKDASATVKGFVNTTTQTFAGIKTFADITITNAATIPNIYGNSSNTGQLNINATSSGGATQKNIYFDGISVHNGMLGRLGINNTSPTYNFHVLGKNTYDNAIIAAQGNSGVSGSFYAMKTAGGVTNDLVGSFEIWNNGTFRAGIKSFQADTTNSNADLNFYTCAAGGSATKRMQITTGGETQITGNVNLTTAGNKVKVATGTNASVGTATLSSGTVTVNTTAVTASSIIILTVQETGTNNGRIKLSARVASTSFTISSSDSGDNCVVAYQIIN